MTAPTRFDYRVEPLANHHDRTAFACGQDSLDRYLKTQASQDMRRKANAVFVLVEPDKPTHIIGYFTLCAFAIEPGAVAIEIRKHIARYPLISATLIGRLAVSTSNQGQGLGSMLLARALRLAYDNAETVGSSMIVVDALDEAAARFYRTHGFIQLNDTMRLILPVVTLGKLSG